MNGITFNKVTVNKVPEGIAGMVIETDRAIFALCADANGIRITLETPNDKVIGITLYSATQLLLKAEEEYD
jgi:hypothetical protein